MIAFLMFSLHMSEKQKQDFKKIHKMCFLQFFADINSLLLFRNLQYLKDGFFARTIWNFCSPLIKKLKEIFSKHELYNAGLQRSQFVHMFLILQGRDGLRGPEGQKGEQGFPVSHKKKIYCHIATSCFYFVRLHSLDWCIFVSAV